MTPPSMRSRDTRQRLLEVAGEVFAGRGTPRRDHPGDLPPGGRKHRRGALPLRRHREDLYRTVIQYAERCAPENPLPIGHRTHRPRSDCVRTSSHFSSASSTRATADEYKIELMQLRGRIDERAVTAARDRQDTARRTRYLRVPMRISQWI